MRSIARGILAAVAGIIGAVIVVMVFDGIVHRTFPTPGGVPTTPEAVRQAISQMPPGAFYLLLTGWVTATAVGAFIASRYSSRGQIGHGLFVTAFMLAATMLNLWAVPHPEWMWPTASILIPVAGFLAAQAATRQVHAPDSS
jgi:hypothetical protein